MCCFLQITFNSMSNLKKNFVNNINYTEYLLNNVPEI